MGIRNRCGRGRAGGLLECGTEGAQVACEENPGREALLDSASALGGVDSIGLGNRRREFAVIVDHDAGAVVLQHLGDGATPGGYDGRAAGQRLEHDQSERLLPVGREEGHAGTPQEFHLLVVPDFAEVLDPTSEARFDQLRENCTPVLQFVLEAQHGLGDRARIRPRKTHHSDPTASRRSSYGQNRVVKVHISILEVAV